MTFGKLFKIKINYCVSKFHGSLVEELFFKLKHKAFPECPCSHSGRLKVLDDPEDFLKFLFGCCYVLQEGKVIDYVDKVPPEIPVLVDISYNIFTENLLFVVKIPQTQLAFEMFMKRRSR